MRACCCECVCALVYKAHQEACPRGACVPCTECVSVILSCGARAASRWLAFLAKAAPTGPQWFAMVRDRPCQLQAAGSQAADVRWQKLPRAGRPRRAASIVRALGGASGVGCQWKPRLKLQRGTQRPSQLISAERFARANQLHNSASGLVLTGRGGSKDTLAEWLRRRPAKPMGSPCVGSNPTGVVCVLSSKFTPQVSLTCHLGPPWSPWATLSHPASPWSALSRPSWAILSRPEPNWATLIVESTTFGPPRASFCATLGTPGSLALCRPESP